MYFAPNPPAECSELESSQNSSRSPKLRQFKSFHQYTTNGSPSDKDYHRGRDDDNEWPRRRYTTASRTKYQSRVTSQQLAQHR